MPRETFLSTTCVAASVIGQPIIAKAWGEPSALAGYSVGGLAGHLARAAITVDRYLDDPPPSNCDGLPDAAAYFVQAMASHDPLDSSIHITVRQRGEEAGSIGPEALVSEIEAIRRRLAGRLSHEPPDRCLKVFGGAPMGLNAYLETRIVELVVHIDDLTSSVGIENPDFDQNALGITTRVLAEVAARRHGHVAVIRALARRERSPEFPRAL